MTPSHAEQFEQQQQLVREVLADVGISIAEYAVLNHIHFGCCRRPDNLGKFAASRDYALGQPVTVRETKQALRACLKRGFLRVISKADLTEIKRDLIRKQFIGPIYGFPEPDHVDFTEAGAKLWLAIEDATSEKSDWPSHRGFAYRETVEIRTRWTCTSRAAMSRCRIRLQTEPNFKSITRPVKVEATRLAWWTPPMKGWAFDVTEEFEWQGRMGGDNASLSWGDEMEGLDRANIRRRCKQCDLTPAELCILLWFANGSTRVTNKVALALVHFARSHLGLRISLDQIIEAIRRCHKRGLIVRLNAAEILRIESTASPSCPPLVARQLLPGAVDLSDAGAKFLIEQAPKILGDTWLEQWTVHQEVFRREHHYARNFLDITSVFEQYSGHSEDSVRIEALQEIGPWCVYWWKRFPKGYRVDLAVTSK